MLLKISIISFLAICSCMFPSAAQVVSAYSSPVGAAEAAIARNASESPEEYSRAIELILARSSEMKLGIPAYSVVITAARTHIVPMMPGFSGTRTNTPLDARNHDDAVFESMPGDPKIIYHNYVQNKQNRPSPLFARAVSIRV